MMAIEKEGIYFMYELNYGMLCVNFIEVLDYCFKNSDSFSLITTLKKPYTTIPPICEHNSIIECWKNCLINIISDIKKWPGTETKCNHKVMLIYNAKKFRRTYRDIPNFFLAIEQNLPEDICFYRDGEVWLYTVTHERSATMVSSTRLDFDFLKSYFI